MREKGKAAIAFRVWICCFLTAVIVGAAAFSPNGKVETIADKETSAIASLLGEWPQSWAEHWWQRLQLDQLQDAAVQTVCGKKIDNDPLQWLGDRMDTFFIRSILNAFGLVYLGMVRAAACLQWLLICLPLAAVSVIVGLLQREINRQTFSFSSPYRFAAKFKLIKWAAGALAIFLLLPMELPPYSLLAAVWVLAALPGFLIAGLQKEI